MNKQKFVYSISIAATPDQIWAALTKPEITVQYWSSRKVQSDWKIGSPVVFWTDFGRELDMKGEVLEYDPPKRLSFTWRAGFDAEADVQRPSKVTYTLRPADSGVEVTITHEDFDKDKVPVSVSQGWPQVFNSLKS